MQTPKTRFRKGDKVQFTLDAIDNYGSEYTNSIFEIEHVATQYMPAREFFAKGQPDGYHPGYDETANGEGLNDLVDLPFSLYDYELRAVQRRH